jgi:hypothetical protein
MARLSGDEREAYRNARYAELRQRAIDHGFHLSIEPPWATSPTEQAASRHAAMRAKLEARRLALQSTASAQPSERPPEAGAVVPAPHVQSVTASTDTPGEPTTTIAATTVQGKQAVARDAEANATDQPQQPAVPPAAPATADQAPEPVATGQLVTAPSAANATGSIPAATNRERLNRPAPPTPPVRPTPPHNAESVASAATAEQAAGAVSNRDAMDEYRQKMRAKFDEFLQQRQAQQDEARRQQREKIETQAAQNRIWFPSGPRAPAYPYTVNPAYGPRQPMGFPAYRAPYWAPPR